MRALLLSAGLGTRLRPLTEFLPKCLVPINGRPLLDFWIDSLLSQGVEEILINTHYCAPLVVDYIARSSWHGRVTLVYEEQLLGTGGALLANRAFFKDEPVLLVHADNLTRFDCNDFFAVHATRPADTVLTMMVFQTPDPGSCGIVELDAAGVVTAFHEKVANPPGNLANAAVYILEPEVIEYMSTLGKDVVDFSTEVIPHFTGRIFTSVNSVYHRDIGTIASWAEAQRDFSMPAASAENNLAWNGLLETLDQDLPQLIQKLSNSLK